MSEKKKYGTISFNIGVVTALYIFGLLLVIHLNSWPSLAIIVRFALISFLVYGSILGISLGIIFSIVAIVQKENETKWKGIRLNVALIFLVLIYSQMQFLGPLNKAKQEAKKKRQQYLESLTIDDYLLFEIKGSPGTQASNSLEKISEFIERGANVNYIGRDGQDTPLRKACRLKQVEVVKFLIEKGADINQVYKRGKWSLLHTAVKFSDVKTVRLLLDLGLNPNAKTDRKETPLHFIKNQLNSEMLQLLIDKGANVNAVTMLKDSCAHFMCYTTKRTSDKTLKILKILLDHNANIALKNRNGNTPLECAKLRKLTKHMELLSKYK